MNTEQHTRIYRVEGMDCTNCAADLQKGVEKLDRVQRVHVDFASGKIHVDGAVTLQELQTRAQRLGFSVIDSEQASTPAEDARLMRGGIVGFWDFLVARHDTRLALIGGGLIALTILASIIGDLDGTAQAFLYTATTIIAGYPLALSGINNLLLNRQFNINLLMSIAAVGAIIIGETLEASAVVFLFVIGEALEGYTTDRARNSLKSLIDLAPSNALKITDSGEETVPVERLNVDDTILVRAGERIPMDGVVLSGTSDVNQAPITGESIPVQKVTKDVVFAGTINGSGTLTIQVTRLAKDNTLSRIIQLVEEAQSSRAPSQRLIDRFAAYYTPAVVVLAFFTATIPPLFFGAPFLDTPETHGWLYRALAMLVIACPCALVISTPVTVIAAITSAARRGVLIKGGAYLEALSTVQTFAFDKTGTLTRGEPVLMAHHAVECTGADNCQPCHDVLALAASVEKRSTHPLARAVVAGADAYGVSEKYAPALEVETLSGKGVRVQVDGHHVTVGSHGYFHEQALDHQQALCDAVDNAEQNGQTTMLISEDGLVRGYVAVADAVREESQRVIADLKSLGGKIVMLTGDNAAVANAVGASLGVDDIRAGLLPEDKVEAVKSLAQRYGSVAMIGDGINDTPALASATVSIAMGGAGTAQALETANIALMGDNLNQLPYAVRLARFAKRLIIQNITLSFVVKVIVLALALLGIASMWLAIVADVGVLLLVTLNGMRPLRQTS